MKFLAKNMINIIIKPVSWKPFALVIHSTYDYIISASISGLRIARRG